jgi:hypothetical protein
MAAPLSDLTVAVPPRCHPERHEDQLIFDSANISHRRWRMLGNLPDSIGPARQIAAVTWNKLRSSSVSGWIMPESHLASGVTPVATKHGNCPRCDSRMLCARIAPGAPDSNPTLKRAAGESITKNNRGRRSCGIRRFRRISSDSRSSTKAIGRRLSGLC